MSKSDCGAKSCDQGMNIIKVKHISSPVMLEAKDAFQFKQIVQHFTGQTSNPTSTRPDTMITTTSSNPQNDLYNRSWKEIADSHI